MDMDTGVRKYSPLSRRLTEDKECDSQLILTLAVVATTNQTPDVNCNSSCCICVCVCAGEELGSEA
jgi:hypothetical protein